MKLECFVFLSRGVEADHRVRTKQSRCFNAAYSKESNIILSMLRFNLSKLSIALALYLVENAAKFNGKAFACPFAGMHSNFFSLPTPFALKPNHNERQLKCFDRLKNFSKQFK
eukprot:scaffold2993_cov266-Chaetoceros_neogracile.AAC.2